MTTTIRYGLNQITKDLPAGTTFDSILRNGNIRAALGYSDNVRALVNGVEMPGNADAAGQTLVIEARCNAKAQSEQTVTVRHGLESATRVFPYGVTVGQVRRNPNVLAALGIGDNMKILINGVEMPDEAIVPNGGTLFAEARCNAKATA